MNPRPFHVALLALLGLCAVSHVFGQLVVAADNVAVAEEQRRQEALKPDISPLETETGPDKPVPFGAHLFKGDFSSLSYTGFNPDYRLAIGDRVRVVIWGTTSADHSFTIDAQGNILIPDIGPVQLAGVRNGDLTNLLSARIKEIYIKGVQVYASLASAQPVKVFVSGYVRKPGLYAGSASDIMLYFLSKAGGVMPESGSYIDISLVRDNAIVETINLYDFLATGRTHNNQFRDGDTLVVNARKNHVQFNGEVLNPHRFEFAGDTVPLTTLLKLAAPQAAVTHVSILRVSAGRSDAELHSVDQLEGIILHPNDLVTVLRQSRPKTILVSIVGEQDGPTRIVLPYGARLGDALSKIVLAPRSNLENVQLFRKSIAARQKAQLEQALDNLARSVTSTPSDSLEEAQLRQVETQTILSFVERARKVEPKGQILLGSKYDGEAVTLENGDIIYVPAHTTLVSVFGEVRFPNTQTLRAKGRVIDYIESAGGYTPTADLDNLIVVKTNGTIVNLSLAGKSAKSYRPEAGDEIFVLPKPDTKRLQFAKDITGILYQIAIGARVVLNP